MGKEKEVVLCPNKKLSYVAGLFETCPQCGETEGHTGLAKPKPPEPPKKKGLAARLRKR